MEKSAEKWKTHFQRQRGYLSKHASARNSVLFNITSGVCPCSHYDGTLVWIIIQ